MAELNRAHYLSTHVNENRSSFRNGVCKTLKATDEDQNNGGVYSYTMSLEIFRIRRISALGTLVTYLALLSH
jgi:hypothetical protein